MYIYILRILNFVIFIIGYLFDLEDLVMKMYKSDFERKWDYCFVGVMWKFRIKKFTLNILFYYKFDCKFKSFFVKIK